MKSKSRQAFNGLALAVIQSTERKGEIRITATSGNLKKAILRVVSLKPENKPVKNKNIR
jgi:hypothetical protein